MSNVDEALAITSKLIEKTNAGKLSWERSSRGIFECILVQGDSEQFKFLVRENQEGNISLTMRDEQGDIILTAESTDLPRDANEDALSDNLRSLYDLARDDALDVNTKLRQVSEMLDRV